MHHSNLSSQWESGENNIRINVQLLNFEENGTHYAYIPSFDLTGYGKNENEASESLQIVLHEFLLYTVNKNTFIKELKRLGWKIKSKSKPIKAPPITEMASSNEQLREILNSKDYRSSLYEVNVPAFA